MVCSFPLGMQAWGFTEQCRSGSATTYVLPGACQHELLSNLKMAATCAGLGSSKVKPNCEQRLAAASARPGAT